MITNPNITLRKAVRVPPGIPKRIIQVHSDWETRHDLPMFEKASSATVRLLNPDFEYLYFSDKDVNSFVSRHFPEYEGLLGSFRFKIQRYDFFRYLAVYQLGGFYFDLDIFLCETLSDLLDTGCVFPFERIGINQYLKKSYNMHWDLGNYAFGAAPGHPFIRAIIDNCVRARTEAGWAQVMLRSIPWLFRKEAYVLCTTGPGLVTRTFAENAQLQSTVTILMPEDTSDRSNWNKFGRYGTHLMKGDWRKRRNRLHNFIWNTCYVRMEERNIRASRARE